MKTLLETILSRKLFDPKTFIYKWLEDHDIKNYTVNDKGEIDVNGDVNLEWKGLTELPSLIQFGTVKGDFICDYNNLTSLRGYPREVGRDFKCSHADLTSLEGSPRVVGRDFHCIYNKLTTLEGAPRKVGGTFLCSLNQLTSLEGAPEEIGRDFVCNLNKLTSLKGAPEVVGGNFNCSFNKTQFTIEDVKNVCKVKHEISIHV